MIISKTPLRISFFGGGTDFREFYRAHGGAVLSAAIGQYVHVLVNAKYDGRVRVSYRENENVDCVCDIKHDIIREGLRIFGVERGVEVVTVADVTGQGTGLGSSSALAVGVINAVSAYCGQSVDNAAQRACEIEIDRLGAPIGEQDQYIAVLGGMRLLRWDTEGRVKSNCIEPGNLAEWLILLDTGVKHQGHTILAQQVERMGNNVPTLKRMMRMAYDGYALALKQDWPAFGALLSEAWELKQQLAPGMTTPAIEATYRAGLDAGAIGGKLCGAGGGGFMLMVVPPDRRADVKAAMGWRELPVIVGVKGSVVRDLQRS